MKNTVVLFFSVLAFAVSAFAQDSATTVQAEMNLARGNPQQYAQIVAGRLAGYRGIEGDRAVREAVSFLQKVKPLPPLERSPGMCAGALSHVLDLGPSGGRGHTGSGGTAPWDRMARFGQWSGRAGENIFYGQRDARGVVIALIVDDGVRGRGHRKNIFSQDFHFTGIATGAHARFGSMCVIDFAGGYAEQGAARVAMAPLRFTHDRL